MDDPVDDAGEAKVKRLDKPYIRTSSKATIMHLKKFLAKKLHLNRTEDVDILCKGEVGCVPLQAADYHLCQMPCRHQPVVAFFGPDPCDVQVLGKECTLQFIARTRWRKHEQLVLTYRPKVDFQA